MPENDFQVDWWWFAVILVIAGVAFAFNWEGKVLQRRLLVGILALWSAVSFAYAAIVGPTLPPQFGEEARMFFRVLLPVRYGLPISALIFCELG
ncbi:MAG: hypothetical protein ABL996_24315, partial [Micropepsaceae bacterium]